MRRAFNCIRASWNDAFRFVGALVNKRQQLQVRFVRARRQILLGGFDDHFIDFSLSVRLRTGGLLVASSDDIDTDTAQKRKLHMTERHHLLKLLWRLRIVGVSTS